MNPGMFRSFRSYLAFLTASLIFAALFVLMLRGAGAFMGWGC